MPVSKAVGIETEYGIALREAPVPLHVTQQFFEDVLDEWIPWDYATESPARDARGIPHFGLSTSQKPRRLGRSGWEVEPSYDDDGADSAYRVLTPSRDLSTMLPNGARFYIDHAHPEYCTPECLTARELVAHDKAGERLLMQWVRRFNRARRPARQVVLLKNNSDHQGNSYGCHENYLIEATLYEDLYNNKAHWLYAYLLPYLISRQVFCGAGKVGLERGTGEVEYQISQRSDFFERVIGLQTMHNRPIINTRDEPHADPDRYRRLHVICGDANMAEWSTYLKVAVTQLVLAMLEAGALDLERDVMLSDPVSALKDVSRDPSLTATVDLEHGHRQYTALEIQRVFLEAGRSFLDSDTAIDAQWGKVWDDWAWVLNGLECAPESLDRHLDWRIKKRFLESQLRRREVDWQHAMAREIDIKYHQLDRENGFFYLLQKAGQVEDLLAEEEVAQAMDEPPASTRAYLRGQCVQRYGDRLSSANWDVLTFRVDILDSARTARLALPDPTAYTKAEVDNILETEVTLVGVMDALKAMASRDGEEFEHGEIAEEANTNDKRGTGESRADPEGV